LKSVAEEVAEEIVRLAKRGFSNAEIARLIRAEWKVDVTSVLRDRKKANDDE
jgi:hypothetical protein